MDFKQLADKLGLEQEEYIELIELFAETSANDLLSLENAMGAKNAGEAEKAAHSLKGASASLGLTDIAELAKMIEINSRENSLRNGSELIAMLKEKIQNLKNLTR